MKDAFTKEEFERAIKDITGTVEKVMGVGKSEVDGIVDQLKKIDYDDFKKFADDLDLDSFNPVSSFNPGDLFGGTFEEALKKVRPSRSGCSREILNRKYPKDIYQNNDSGCVTTLIAIPGREKTDFSVQLKGDKLIVKASEISREDGFYHLKSLVTDAYEETFNIEFEVEDIRVKYTQGILSIKLYPKTKDDVSFEEIVIN